MKYFIYCRKSSEGDDKQVLSNPAQKLELTSLANKEKLSVVGIYEEEKSAHSIGRIKFNEMLTRIENGEADGIIVWDESRIARNSLDGGKVIYMLDENKIQEIRKPGKTYRNTPDDKSWLAMCFMMSKKDSDDKGVNVKRGLKMKATSACVPPYSWTKAGFLWDKFSERGDKKFIDDPIRWTLIDKMFDLMLTGAYTPPQLLKILNEDWNYTTPVRKTIGGGPMQRSTIYRILTDPFYYGEFEYPLGSGNWIQGTYSKMITKDEFDRIQVLLGRKGKPRAKKHAFPYTGLIRCGECQAMITAEEKRQIICPQCKYKFSSNNKEKCPKCSILIEEMVKPTLLHYNYYHCTKRKDPNCSQKSIKIEELEQQVDELLSRIEISPRFTEWALTYLNEQNDKEVQDRTVIIKSQRSGYDDVVSQIDNLVKLKISPQNSDGSILPDEIYEPQMQGLLKKKKELKDKLDNSDLRIDKWLELTEKTFNFACYARYHFANGDTQTKREILLGLGPNLMLKDGIVRVDLLKPLQFLEEAKNEINKISARLEPTEKIDNTLQMEALWDQNLTLLRD